MERITVNEEPETVQGEIDVPADDVAEAELALERVESAGLMPAGVEQAQAVTYREAIELGHVLAQSGYFKDATTAAQAAVKVMVGSELGFAPMASIMGVHVIEGRPSVGGRLLGAVLKRDPHYDYRIDRLEVERDPAGKPIGGGCVVVITLDGNDLSPVSSFDWGEAVQAGLVKDKSNWIKWPTKMLFWRALSWGVDFHCPHLVGGIPLIAAEDAEADAGAEQAPSLVRELNPPADRPPPLADDEAEELRKAAQAAYDRVRALNPTLVPPAKFANQIANAEHSHERLRQVVSAFEDVANNEQAIVEATAKLLELTDQESVDRVLGETARMGSRAEVADHLQAAVNVALDAEQSEGEGEGDGAA